MDKYIVVYRLRDSSNARPVAVVYPSGRVAGTRDPELVWAIRAALTEDSAVYSPQAGKTLHGAASRRDPLSLDWATAVLGALSDQGLRGRAVGYD
jgi:hypothetical protein